MRIPHMKNWPNLPTPWRTRDWQETARRVTLLSMDERADALYFPVSTYFEVKEPLSGGYQGENYGTVTYFRKNNKIGRFGEAVAQLSAVLTAAMTDGLDPRNLFGRDYVKMAQAYFSRTPDGRGFVGNNTPVTDCPGSFWYTFYPTCLYLHLAAQYPEDKTLEGHIREIADTWLDALDYISTWDVMGVSLARRELVPGGHTEPEGIIGAAYVFLMAHARFGDAKYLDAARRLMADAAERSYNPYYEIVGSYAPVIAARLNAEINAGLPLGRMLDWVFSDGKGTARSGWGVINRSWGEYDAYGLAGSLTDTDGYAFAMNTFVTAGALAPVARYAPQYAHDLGKYLTAVASNSHMFFGDGLPKELQDDGDYVAQTGLGCLVYEGVRHHSKHETPIIPFATGDAKHFRGPEGTNFSFYSSGPIGMLASMIGQTNVQEILRFDLLKTDFEHGTAYPTYLLYNPLADDRQVSMPLPEGVYDVFDAVRCTYLCRAAQGHADFCLAADEAVVAVLLPAGAALTRADGKWLANGVVVHYPAESADMENVADNTVLGGEQHLQCCVQLEDGDAALRWRLLCHGKLVTAGEGQPGEIVVTLPAGNGALRLEVDTVQGRKLSCAKGVRTLPAPETCLLKLADEALLAALDPHETATLGMDPRGVMVTTGEPPAELTGPRVTLHRGKAPMLLVEVTYSWGPWGVSVDVNGVRHCIQSNLAGEGVYLYDLSPVMADCGSETAEADVVLHVGRRGCRVAFRSVSVYETEQ